MEKQPQDSPTGFKLFGLAHNHSEPNTHGQFKCKACDLYNKDIYPSEDGFYKSEGENPEFCALYWKCLESLDAMGLLREVQTDHGKQIDNELALKLTRETYKLINPDFQF